MSTLNIANLDRLISHLEGLPEEKFDMRNFYTKDETFVYVDEARGKVLHSCGTAACIAGWIYEIAPEISAWVHKAGDWIGLNFSEYRALFMPDGYQKAGSGYPLSRAIRALKHMRSEFLRTGTVVVDWDAPEPAERLEWSAPVASERTLLAALTSLLATPVYGEVL